VSIACRAPRSLVVALPLLSERVGVALPANDTERGWTRGPCASADPVMSSEGTLAASAPAGRSVAPLDA